LTSARGTLQLLIAQVFGAAGLRVEEFGLGDRKPRLPGDGHGVRALSAELFLEGGVLADGFNESDEVFLAHRGGGSGWFWRTIHEGRKR